MNVLKTVSQKNPSFHFPLLTPTRALLFAQSWAIQRHVRDMRICATDLLLALSVAHCHQND